MALWVSALTLGAIPLLCLEGRPVLPFSSSASILTSIPFSSAVPTAFASTLVVPGCCAKLAAGGQGEQGIDGRRHFIVLTLLGIGCPPLLLELCLSLSLVSGTELQQ
jgi:hypothetical protein